MLVPEKIEPIGNEVAIRWSDASEDFIPMEALRRYSPSAENQGEKDLLGQPILEPQNRDFAGVTVTGWEAVGGYAVLFRFSDGHQTGIYSFDYLKSVADALKSGDASS